MEQKNANLAIEEVLDAHTYYLDLCRDYKGKMTTSAALTEVAVDILDRIQYLQHARDKSRSRHVTAEHARRYNEAKGLYTILLLALLAIDGREVNPLQRFFGIAFHAVPKDTRTKLTLSIFHDRIDRETGQFKPAVVLANNIPGTKQHKYVFHPWSGRLETLLCVNGQNYEISYASFEGRVKFEACDRTVRTESYGKVRQIRRDEI